MIWRSFLLIFLSLIFAQPASANPKMCIFGMGGQSNAEGFGERGGPLVPPLVWTYQTTAPFWMPGNDPSNKGSMRPTFGSEFYNLTGYHILFVKNTVNGGFQTDAGNSVSNGPASASWDVNGSATPSMIAVLQAAQTWATNSGFDAVQCGMLWSQGESEGNGIWQYETGRITVPVTKAIYKSAMLTMIDRFRTAFGATYPFYILRTGALSNEQLALPALAGIDTGYSQVRDAQEEVALASPYNLMATRLSHQGHARDQYIDPVNQGVHYNQDLNDLMGFDAARHVHASGLWNRWP